MKKTILFIILLYANALYSQDNTKLFEYVNSDCVLENINKGGSNTFVNINDVQLKKTDDINFVLPNGKKHFVKKTLSYINENKYNAWAGRIVENGKVVGFAYFTEKYGNTFGKIYTLEKSYLIKPVGKSLHIMQELNPIVNEGNDCLTSFFNEEINQEYDEQMDSLYFIENNNDENKYDFPLENTSQRTLRIAFLYTPEALNYYLVSTAYEHNSSTILDFINFYVEELNFIFAYSQINLKAVFAYASLTDNETPSHTMNEELNDFRFAGDENANYDEIFEIDPLLNADVSVLLINKGTGYAYYYQKSDKFIVNISYLENNLTLPHELGHVFGCNHNIEEYNRTERLPLNILKSYGYANASGGYRSIMSYRIGEHTVKMPFYSVPELEFGNGMRGAYIYDSFWSMQTATNCWGAIMGNSGNVIVRRADYDENNISRTVNSGTYSNHYDIVDVVAEDYVCKSGSEVLMHARNSVKLKPGFKAEAGSNFRAYISDYDCPPSSPQESITPKKPDVEYFNGGLTDPTTNAYLLCPCESWGTWGNHAIYFVIDDFDGIATNYSWELSSSNGLLTWGGWNDDSFVCGISRNFGDDWIPNVITLSVYGINAYGVYGPPDITYIELLPEDDAICVNYCGDKNKNNKVLETTTNEFFKTKNKFKLYPNPANKTVTLAINSQAIGNVVCSVKDISGKEYFSKQLNVSSEYFKTEINLSNFPTGIYFVNIRGKDFSETMKLIVQ